MLVKNNNGRYWSFPKGHIEDGETEQETAIREIKEETGLDVTLVNNFREISEYCPFGKIRKRVVFFLARAFTDNVRIQDGSICSRHASSAPMTTTCASSKKPKPPSTLCAIKRRWAL